MEKQQEKAKKKILVCAPSNAAIDELIGRLKDGIETATGIKLNPRIVRLGRPEVVTGSAKNFTIESQLDQGLQLKEINRVKAEISVLARKVSKAAEDTRHMERRIANKCKCKKCLKDPVQDVNAAKIQLNNLKELSKNICNQIHQMRENNSINIQKREGASRRLIKDADIVVSTLSGAGQHSLRVLNLEFQTVIVDEAAQCVEPSLLIPLQYKARRCILVGDPKQLPPTVLSKYGTHKNYGQSLFLRMYMAHPSRTHMLNVQYRMNPDISKFPNQEFYQGKLMDGPENGLKTARPWHMAAQGLLTPFRFFNVIGEEAQNQLTKSYFNKNEADFVYELYQFLRGSTQESLEGKVGIISMYREQVSYIKSVFERNLSADEVKGIYFSTVDGFQGQEKDVIILSCVRAKIKVGKDIGFLSDKRRMNVALTRAKAAMWVVGNRRTLNEGRTWGRLVQSAVDRGLISSAQIN